MLYDERQSAMISKASLVFDGSHMRDLLKKIAEVWFKFMHDLKTDADYPLSVFESAAFATGMSDEFKNIQGPADSQLTVYRAVLFSDDRCRGSFALAIGHVPFSRANEDGRYPMMGYVLDPLENNPSKVVPWVSDRKRANTFGLDYGAVLKILTTITFQMQTSSADQAEIAKYVDVQLDRVYDEAIGRVIKAMTGSARVIGWIRKLKDSLRALLFDKAVTIPIPGSQPSYFGCQLASGDLLRHIACGNVPLIGNTNSGKTPLAQQAAHAVTIAANASRYGITRASEPFVGYTPLDWREVLSDISQGAKAVVLDSLKDVIDNYPDGATGQGGISRALGIHMGFINALGVNSGTVILTPLNPSLDGDAYVLYVKAVTASVGSIFVHTADKGGSPNWSYGSRSGEARDRFLLPTLKFGSNGGGAGSYFGASGVTFN